MFLCDESFSNFAFKIIDWLHPDCMFPSSFITSAYLTIHISLYLYRFGGTCKMGKGPRIQRIWSENSQLEKVKLIPWSVMVRYKLVLQRKMVTVMWWTQRHGWFSPVRIDGVDALFSHVSSKLHMRRSLCKALADLMLHHALEMPCSIKDSVLVSLCTIKATLKARELLLQRAA